MSSSAQTDTGKQRGTWLVNLLTGIERAGNKLPHPFWLFAGLAVITLLLSALLSKLGVSAVSPADNKEVAVVSLLSPDGINKIITEAVPNFTGFPPLGLIIIVMLGVAVAEQSGLISASIRGVVARVSPKWLTFVLALAGVTGSVASDAVYVVLIPLGAVTFKTAGRSPVLGAVVAFGSCSAGFNASLLVTATDAILAGLSTSAAQLIDESVTVSPVANYFFSIASAIVLALIVTLVTELLLVRTTKDMIDDEPDEEAASADEFRLSPAEKRGVILAFIVGFVFLALYLAALLWPNSIFQGEEGVLDSPLLSAIVVPIALMFAVVGVVYGLVTRSITKAQDIPEMMGKGLLSLAPVMVLFFAAAQFVAYFKWSNIGPIIAIKASELLQQAQMPTLVMFAGLVLLVALLNLLITSGSAQYALMAPVIVPMFMLLGVSPEVTQMLFRIGDSPTNIISPMSPYFALALGYVQQYYSRARIGTLLSLTLPLSVAMLVGWFAFFALWYALGLPLGPGVPVR